MFYRTVYKTPGILSDIIIESDGKYLTGLWFEGLSDSEEVWRSRGSSSKVRLKKESSGSQDPPAVVTETVRWLDIYFSGKDPGFTPEYRLSGLTPFRSDVIDELLKIPYGQTVTYGQIAKRLAEKRGIPKMSAQAVGGAVGWNPVCLIIPCHRVIGSDGSLTGYGGGIINKAALLELEGSV